MKYNGSFVENFLIANALSSSADAFSGTVLTDVFDLKNFEKATFLIQEKANASSTTGTTVVKAQGVTSVAASNAVDMAFNYAAKTTGASDTWTAPAAVAAGSSFTVAANKDTIYAVEVSARDLPSGCNFVQLQLVEGVNAPIVGSILVILSGYKYGYPFATALT